MRKKNKTLILLLASILLWPSAIFAQSVIKGTVTDASTGAPLIGASVTVIGTKTTTLTNHEGVFTLSVADANRNLEITFVGMHPK